MSEVHIDASKGEGGGQIVRLSVSLAALLRKPITVDNIRANRPRGGLMAQHLTGVRLVSRDLFGDVCQVEGDQLHSKSLSLKFDPVQSKSSNEPATWKIINADIGTAGACTLLVQIVLPCLLFLPQVSEIHLSGGTNVAFSPPVDEMRLVLFPLLNRLFGFQVTLDIVKRGFYPRGGGKLRLAIDADTVTLPLRCFDMTQRGKLSKIQIHGFASRNQFKSQDAWIEHIVEAVIKFLSEYDMVKNVSIETHDVELILDHQCSLTLVAKTDDNKCLFSITETYENDRRHIKKGKQRGSKGRNDKSDCMLDDCKKIAANAVKRLINELGPVADENSAPCVDSHVEDQLIVFMALAEGNSKLRCSHPLTMHTRSAIDICQKLTGAIFSIVPPSEDDNIKNSTCVIQCQGIGFQGLEKRD